MTEVKRKVVKKENNKQVKDNIQNENIEQVKKIKYIDLCSGIGGFRIGIEQFAKKNNLEFECVLSADIKPDAIKTYNLNFNEINKKNNVMDLHDNLPQFDMLCAGFPCQPFSSAGSKKGFDDHRGSIIFKIIELAKKYTPEYIILENVANLITLNKGRDIKKICDEFEKIKYNVSYKKLNAKDFGVPQNRERVFIVCCKSKKINLENIEFLEKKYIKDILDYNDKRTDIDEKFAAKIIDLHNKKKLFGYKMQDKRGGEKNIHSWDISLNGSLNSDEIELINKLMTERRKKHWAVKKNIPWMDGMPLTLQEIKTFYNHKKLQNMLNNLVKLKYLTIEKPKKIVNKKRVYDEDGEDGYNICKGKLSFPISNILNPNEFSPTLTATDSNKIVIILDDKYIRKLSKNELKLICGFPIDYKISDDVNYYDLFGNMVVPPIIKQILKCIFGN
jgi:DNA (cytosine-5)-methyltransferase 1